MMQSPGPARRLTGHRWRVKNGHVKRIIVLLALCLGTLGSVPALAQGRNVFFRESCNDSVYEPKAIVLTCADAAEYLETPRWEEWGSNQASTIGTLTYPKCPGTILCPSGDYEDKVRVTLRRPEFCPRPGRWQFTRLRINDLTRPLYEGMAASRAYTCSYFAPYHPPPYWHSCAPVLGVVSGDMLTHRIGCRAARRVIRKVLVKGQTAQTTHVRAKGFTCGLRPYAARPVTCSRGEQRILSPLPG